MTILGTLYLRRKRLKTAKRHKARLGGDMRRLLALGADLAYLYAGATSAKHVVVKLATDTDSDASRFDTADVDYRLVTTYRGPGTEWVPTRALARSAPGRPHSPDAIRQLDRGAVAIIKGERGATADAPGLLHRLSRCAETPRLSLSIDSGDTIKGRVP